MGADWSTILTQVGVVWAASAVVMAILKRFARVHGDAGLVDVGWAACLGTAAVGLALWGDGAPVQRIVVGAVGGVWGWRLALHLLFDRVLGKQEDGRYRYLREHWGEAEESRFAWFFQAQALLVALLAMPFAIAAGNPATSLAALQIAGLGLFIVAKAGEALADHQLARFRADPANRGKTCRRGLWRYSRHPNYFFEWLIWVGFALLAWPAPGGAWALAGPAAMYLFVTKISGIPWTEQQSLRSRGADYAAYQRSTSPFFPWPPRRDLDVVEGSEPGGQGA